MSRWISFVLVALLLIVAGAGALLVFGVRAIDPKMVIAIAADRVKASTGRELQVRGPIELSLWPRLAVVAEDVSLGNAPWGIRREMVRIQRVEGQVRIWPLLSKRVEVEELRLLGPDLLLETDREGRGNWELGVPQPGGQAGGTTERGAGQAGAASALPIAAGRLRIENGRIAFRDGATGVTTTGLVHSLTVGAPVSDGRTTLTLDASFRDQRFSVTALSDPIERWIAGPGPHPLSLTAVFAGATVRTNGTLQALAPFNADLRVDADLTATDALSRLLNTPLALPLPAKASAALSARSPVFELKELAATLREQPIRGELVIRGGGARPSVQGTLQSPGVDLRAWSAASPAGTGASATSAAPGASGAPATGGASAGSTASDALLPVAVFRAIDADLRLAIDRLTTGEGQPLDQLDARIVIAGNRLSIDPLRFTTFGGTIDGRLVGDAPPGRPPTLALKLGAQGLDGPAIVKAAGSTLALTGAPTRVDVDVTGPAESWQRFREGASGRVVVQAGRGTIGTLQDRGGFRELLAIAIPTLGRGTTELQCAVARLDLQKGVATSRRGIAIETDRINAVVSGTIGLADERLDLVVRPSLRKGMGAGIADLVQVVHVRGTLSQPQVVPDTLDAARAAISIGGALSSGGMSALAGQLLRRGSEDPNPCRTALSGVAREPAETAQDRARAPDAAREAEREAIRSLRDNVKKLFRR